MGECQNGWVVRARRIGALTIDQRVTICVSVSAGMSQRASRLFDSQAEHSARTINIQCPYLGGASQHCICFCCCCACFWDRCSYCAYCCCSHSCCCVAPSVTSLLLSAVMTPTAMFTHARRAACCFCFTLRCVLHAAWRLWHAMRYHQTSSSFPHAAMFAACFVFLPLRRQTLPLRAAGVSIGIGIFLAQISKLLLAIMSALIFYCPIGLVGVARKKGNN